MCTETELIISKCYGTPKNRHKNKNLSSFAVIYPNEVMTEEEAIELIEFAAEGRKRVKDQLYVIDETFKAEPAVFKYINLKTGNEVQVETLERISNPSISNPAEENSDTSEIDDQTDELEEIC